jgi:tetrapyrrole methylase family protein / MazG family protein
MATITVVGLGPGPLSQMTREAEQHLVGAAKVFFRASAYPAYDWLHGLGKSLVSFDGLYSMPWPDAAVMYEFMVDALLREVSLRDEVTFALPGSPLVLEDTVQILKARGPAAGVDIRIIHGLSFVEVALAVVDFDFRVPLQVVLPRLHLQHDLFDSRSALLVCQPQAAKHPTDASHIDLTIDWLRRRYPPDHPVVLIWTSGLPAYRTEHDTVPLADLARTYGDGKYHASLFVPPLTA